MAADETKPADAPESVAKDAAQAAEGTGPEAVAKGGGALADATGQALNQVLLADEASSRATVAKSAGLQVVVYDRAGGVCHVDPARIGERIAKADASADADAKTKMVAVFDAKGDLVGVCDPADITPVAGADAPAPNEEAPEDAKPAEPAPDASDLTPAPAAETGTPADDVAKADGETAAASDDEDPQAVLKSIVTAAMSEVLGSDPVREDVRKQAEVITAQSQEIEALKARLETVENTPAAPKVFTSGQTPPPGTLRGQDRGAGGQPVDVAKARERKAELYAASGPDQARIATEMQTDAIGIYEAMRAAR